jgi:photosystem II stability/assembly factor-like uncharacterized protein
MTDTAPVSNAGGPPRFYVLSVLPSGALIAGTCGRGIARAELGSGSWTAVDEGPRVVNGLAIGADGTLIVACTATGLHRSLDDGCSWTSFALDGHSAYAVEARAVLRAGLIGAGVRESRDGGATWIDAAPELSSTSVFRVVTLASGRTLAATEGKGVWASDGEGWWPAGLDGASVFSLRQLPGGRVLAGTRGDGIHRSDDDGVSWSPSSIGLHDSIVHTIVSRDEDVYAGTGLGIAHSRDRGDTWTPLGGELAHHRIFSVAIDDSGLMYAGSYDGVWVSHDAASWLPVDTGLSAGEAFSLFTDERAGTWAGAKAGIIHSVDDGSTWARCDAGAEHANAYAFMVGADATVLAATDHGVLAWADVEASAQWHVVGLAGLRAYSLMELGRGDLMAGTLGDGLHRRVDGRWRRVGETDLPPLVFDLRRSRRSGQVLAATGAVIAGVKTGGIYRSADDGATWTMIGHEPITTYRIVETSDGVLFAGAQGSVVLRSDDGGHTWQICKPAHDGSKMYCLAIDRLDRLYLGSGARLLRSHDGGRSWPEVGEGLDGVTTYGLVHRASGALIAATSSGIYRSVDDAASWSQPS